ncbi:immunity 49 family protein [Streptomyces sp. NPDC055099]
MNENNTFGRSDAPDHELPMLTTDQADRLRALAAPYAQEGHTHSLRNLAQRCRKAPQEHWPEMVAGHFAGLAEAGKGDESAAELLRGVHARLIPTNALTQEIAGAMSYARVVAEGLVFAYALDMPASVRMLTDPDVERAGIEELGQAAYANLMRVPVEHDEVPVEGGAVLHSLYGDSPFVASKALYLSETVRQVTGESLPDAGALFVVPTRHLLAYHPIADGSVADAINALAAYGLGAYEDGPGSLSPRVYWWHEGRLTSITVIDHDTLSFSLQPPPELLGRLKGLVRLDAAGRLDTATAAKAPDVAALTHATADAITGLAEDPAGLGDAFASALTLAHAHCAADPKASYVGTWDAWAVSVQLGTALFAGASAQKCWLGEDMVPQLPATPAAPPAQARAWLDAFYVAVACRQNDRADRLCQVPLEVLRQDDSVDAYVLHWIDTLQTYWSERPMDDVVAKLLTTMENSYPESLTHTPKDFADLIDYQPVALFHRLIARDHDAFTKALAEAVDHHRTYWGDSTAPRARVALGVLAMASLAYDYGFPVDMPQPYLPTYLLNRERIEEIPPA